MKIISPANRGGTLVESLDGAITLSQAAKLFPNRPHTSTVYRWGTVGVRGVVLKTVISGGRILVQRSAIEEFLANLNQGKSRARNTSDKSKSAGVALEKLGC